MRLLGYIAALLLLTAFAFQSPSTAGTDGWLPLKRSDVIRLLAAEKDIEVVKVDTLDELRRILSVDSKSAPDKIHYLAARPSELSSILSGNENLAPDDIISIVGNAAIPLTIVTAGNNEDIHSLRITAPVVNYRESELPRVYGVLSALFKRLYPGWPDAGEWPMKSLQQAWDNHPLNKTLKDPNEMIIRKQLDGITSATFGVPPDIIFYTVTAREQCVPRIDESNPLRRVDPFRRLIC